MKPVSLHKPGYGSGAKPKVALYRETLQTTGFYVGRVVIVTREFASISSPPLRCRSLQDSTSSWIAFSEAGRNLSVRCG